MGFEDGGIDLHIHSTASDGTLSPAGVLARGAALGLRALSITDHDTVDGVVSALESGIPPKLAFVTGVEVSAGIPDSLDNGQALHLLGYFIRPSDPGLASELVLLKKARAERNPRIVAKLNALGIPLRMEHVERIADGGQVGRPHMAAALVEMGAVPSQEAAFDRYLAQGRPAYEEKFRLPAPRAIAAIKGAGGLAVMAHPGSLSMDDRSLERLVAVLSDMGLAGMEAYYPGHTPSMIKKFSRMARRAGLFVTGGTDFHGDNKPSVAMGSGKGDLFVPFSLYEEMARAHARQAAGA